MITVDEFLVLGGQVGGHNCCVFPPPTVKFRAALEEPPIKKMSVVLFGKQRTKERIEDSPNYLSSSYSTSLCFPPSETHIKQFVC